MQTKEADFWSGTFGKEYTDRNSRISEEWDNFYLDNWGITKLGMNERFIGHLPKNSRILEVGCNTGMQLNGLQRMGFTNLYGVEIQDYAVEKSKSFTKSINIVQGSGFDLPFRDDFFEVVCTNGVLIHIAPGDLNRIMTEMYRCSNKFIWGFEYFAEEITNINYRGHENYLWKADYADLFLAKFPNLRLIKNELYPYKDESGNVDCMYLLEKRSD